MNNKIPLNLGLFTGNIKAMNNGMDNKRTTSGQQADIQGTSREHPGNTNKNDKNDKNVKKRERGAASRPPPIFPRLKNFGSWKVC